MFGIANQLLAVVALAVAGSVMVNAGRARYLWVVVVPMAFVTVTTTSAGLQLIDRFMILAHSPQPSDSFKGYLNVFLIIAMMLCVAIILVEALRHWIGPVARTPLPSGKAAEA
jgi:carbon starvation protein